MAMKSLGSVGIGIAVLTIACGGNTPLAPTQLNNRHAVVTETPTSTVSSATPPTLTTASTSEIVVTLQSDGTASPPVVSVPAGRTILMVNNTSKYVLVRSYNCSEFSSMGLQPGVARHTMPFDYPGDTCNYFVWNYPQKTLEGQVNVY